MASEGRQPADTSRQLLRAKRISDAEWEMWRERLIELYLENDVSRKEIVDTMAREHKFIITETQLKRRFQLWGVKKYIPHQDMTAILSVKTQHDAAGNQIRIQYKDRDIDHERIERAFKRRKGPFNAPRSIPPYIQYCVRPQQSPSTHTLISSGNPANVRFSNKQIPASLAGTQELESTAVFKAPFGTVPWSVGSRHPMEDVQNCALSQPADNGDTLQHPNFIFEDDVDDQVAAQPSIWAPDSELPNFLNWSQDGHASHEAPYLLLDVSRLPDPLNNFPFDLSASPLQESRSHGSLPELGREESPLRPHESAGTRVLDPFIFEGSNPEEVVLPLHLLKICFPAHLDWDSLGEYVGSASTLANLFHFVNSMQLPLEIEDLLCHCFEMSARSIRERQAMSTGCASRMPHCPELPEASTQLSRPYSDNWIRRNNRITKGTEGKVSHYLMWAVSKGVIKLCLTSRAERPIIGLEPKPQSMLSVSFMPREDRKTTGITIDFKKAQDARPGTAISRRIKIFNVVPKDSEVIRCVSRNDLRSLQTLFDKRQASPLDVDPQGFSLLSYAMYNGCSEVYLLLLQGGASTQNCDCFGISLDIVWAIWSTFADYNSRMLPESYYLPNVIRDFDQVVSMTDAALHHGCDIEKSTGYMPQMANALFEIARWCPLKAPHLSVPEKAINYLLKVGYDLERRNPQGLTPFLHAANSHQPQVIQCLDTYIKRGADISAIDLSGRGALHLALAVPHCFDGWKTLRLTDYIMFDVSSYYYVPMCVFDTENVGYAKDYEDVGLDPKPLQHKVLTERTIRRGKVCLGDCQSSRMHRIEMHHSSAKLRLDWTVPSDVCGCGIDFDDYAAQVTADGEPRVPDGPAYEHIVCKDFSGAEHFIKHPIKVLKTRLRFKLLTLLRANCDPNILDNAGASPSDYARRDGLWPQWHWALKNTGFSYDPGSDRWVRALTS